MQVEAHLRQIGTGAVRVLPLELLKAGEQGRVLEIEGDRGLVSRLAEMGLREGVHVRMVRGGSPCIVALDSQRLSFRAEDAAIVLIEVDQ